MSRTTPTQRTMRHLRQQGCKCAVVEKWNQHAGPFGIRQDLFGIIDILVLDPERGVVGVQACGIGSHAAHKRKMIEERHQECIDWLETPGTKLEIWSWSKRKVKRGGVAVRWAPRVEEITLRDLSDWANVELRHPAKDYENTNDSSE